MLRGRVRVGQQQDTYKGVVFESNVVLSGVGGAAYHNQPGVYADVNARTEFHDCLFRKNRGHAVPWHHLQGQEHYAEGRVNCMIISSTEFSGNVVQGPLLSLGPPFPRSSHEVLGQLRDEFSCE